MREEFEERPRDLEPNEKNEKGDSLARHLAGEVEVLAADLNVRYVVLKARDEGSAMDLAPEQIEERAVARIQEIYPVGYSKAGTVEAARQILASSDQD